MEQDNCTYFCGVCGEVHKNKAGANYCCLETIKKADACLCRHNRAIKAIYEKDQLLSFISKFGGTQDPEQFLRNVKAHVKTRLKNYQQKT